MKLPIPTYRRKYTFSGKSYNNNDGIWNEKGLRLS